MKLEKGRVLFESEEDLLPLAMSIGTTLWNQTGSWKYLEPYYQDSTPPCINACKVGNDIVTFMRLIEEGRYEEAARGVLENNPFPATLGRVCPHPCETPCNRKALGGAIAIQSAERFLGDYALEHGILPEVAEVLDTSVMVVGAGSSGLAAAYFLRLLGHEVSVIDAEDRPGGLLWMGIPPFRLPRNTLQGELERLQKIGIRFEYGIRLGRDVTIGELRSQTDALLLAVGLGGSRALGIPGEEHPQVLDGIKVLRNLHLGNKPDIGHRVAVIGGGNTALDCARSLLRLGHEVTILYRRTKTEMPAFKDEISEALEEGIRIEFLTAPSKVLVEDGKMKGLECIRMKLGDPDASRRRKPIAVEGSEFVIPVDAVVKALGEVLGEREIPNSISAAGAISTVSYATCLPSVFACGDALGTDGGTVAQAIKSGREAAYALHAYLTGEEYRPPDLLKEREASAEIAKFKQFNTSYFKKELSPQISHTDVESRKGNFQEIRSGLSESQIRSEASRCFKCGTCNLCDNCRVFCPDNAIAMKPDGSGYEILYEYCKGCMVCVEECPRAAIHLRKVEV